MNRSQRFPFAPGTITRSRRRVPRWQRLLVAVAAWSITMLVLVAVALTLGAVR